MLAEDSQDRLGREVDLVVALEIEAQVHSAYCRSWRTRSTKAPIWEAVRNGLMPGPGGRSRNPASASCRYRRRQT